jgi:hypothetical protein
VFHPAQWRDARPGKCRRGRGPCHSALGKAAATGEERATRRVRKRPNG